MPRIDASRPVPSRDALNRRDFLQCAGALPLLGLGLPRLDPASLRVPAGHHGAMSCILLYLVGGPSHLDTWDMKPDATAEVRGPFRPIATRVPGVFISEIFPRLASQMDKVALVRGVHHDSDAVHDLGHQMLQTGRRFDVGLEHPHFGCVVANQLGPRGDLPPHVLLPRPIGATGGSLPHGQNAGYLGSEYDPFVLHADPNAPDFRVLHHEAFDLSREANATRERYGRTQFGQGCLLARRLVEHGVRFVTVNMYETVFNQPTWDIHGASPFRPIDAYADEVGPNFDNAYSSLLEDLADRGLLESTMVLAFGEFGRTPKINRFGGRDHHPGCGTALFAGGPFRGGRVVGASDPIGHAPYDRPVTPAEIAATVYHGFGIDRNTVLPGPDGRPIPLLDQGAEPIHELF
jgi:hypothetical protein